MTSQSAKTLSHIGDVEQLSERVIRVLGLNPGSFRLQGTNTYLVGTGNSRILVDTGSPDKMDYIASLQSVLHKHSITIQEILITHWHQDHIGGVPNICKHVTKDQNTRISKFKRKSKHEEDIELGDIKINYDIKDGQVFNTEGATLRAMYTPGHADDHMCLELEEEQAIFTGDTVLGEGTCVFEDLYDYMKSLEKIRSREPRRLYPAHGAMVTDPDGHLEMYITHRMRRETQILAALSESDAELSVMEIVNIVYKNLSEDLIKGATNNVTHHLTKLIKEDKVAKIPHGTDHVYSRIMAM